MGLGLSLGDCCDGLTCGRTVVYPQGSAQLESDFYYALNTPSNQTFYNPVTGLTMLYTDTTGNLGTLDDVGVVVIKTLDGLCFFQALRYGTAELEAFILRGHTVVIAIEFVGAFNCFDAADKAIVDALISSLGGSAITTVRDTLYPGCQTISNAASANNLNAGITTWRTGGTSRLTISGSAFEVIRDTFGRILVAAVVSSLSGNTNKGKVIVFGDDDTLDSCAAGLTLQRLYDNICTIIGQDIA